MKQANPQGEKKLNKSKEPKGGAKSKTPAGPKAVGSKQKPDKGETRSSVYRGKKSPQRTNADARTAKSNKGRMPKKEPVVKTPGGSQPSDNGQVMHAAYHKDGVNHEHIRPKKQVAGV